jgi:hypothetical protein
LTQHSRQDALTALRGLPDRLDDTALAMVEQIATAPCPALPRATPEHFAACLRSLSILPRRADDDSTGEQRVKIYARLLGEYPADAISYMTRTALQRCRWFPTVAECIEIMNAWRRDDAASVARVMARNMATHEHEQRYRELATRVRRACAGDGEFTTNDIDRLSDRQRAALDRDHLIWRMPSGRWRLCNQRWPEALADDARHDQQVAA